MQIIDRVSKRVWITGGVILALCGGVAAASAGSKATPAEPTPVFASQGRVLKLAYASPPPTEMPAPATDRLDVLAAPPESLANLDPDLQQSSDYAALAASMKRYEARLSVEMGAADTRPLPASLADPSPRMEPAAYAPPMQALEPPSEISHADDVAASGDTGRLTSHSSDAD